MVGHPRPIDNYRPEVGSSVARAQPASVPILADPPTADELPTDEQGEPVGLLYINQATGEVSVTAPDGSGGVTTAVLMDMSADITLDTGDITGLL